MHTIRSVLDCSTTRSEGKQIGGDLAHTLFLPLPLSLADGFDGSIIRRREFVNVNVKTPAGEGGGRQR